MPKIVVNGKEYDSPDDMPPEIRQLWQSFGGLLADDDNDGIPDIAQRNAQVMQSATFVVDGKTYESLDQVPPEARRRYEEAMARLDANRDGIPDLLQHNDPGQSAAAPAPRPFPNAPPATQQPQLVKVVGTGPGPATWVFLAVAVVLLAAIGAVVLLMR